MLDRRIEIRVFDPILLEVGISKNQLIEAVSRGQNPEHNRHRQCRPQEPFVYRLAEIKPDERHQHEQRAG